MTIEDTTNQIAGTIPLVVVSGVAMKMTNSMFGNSSMQSHTRSRKNGNHKNKRYNRRNNSASFFGGTSPF